mgnify:CR=1 FL=1
MYTNDDIEVLTVSVHLLDLHTDKVSPSTR